MLEKEKLIGGQGADFANITKSANYHDKISKILD